MHAGPSALWFSRRGASIWITISKITIFSHVRMQQEIYSHKILLAFEQMGEKKTCPVGHAKKDREMPSFHFSTFFRRRLHYPCCIQLLRFGHSSLTGTDISQIPIDSLKSTKSAHAQFYFIQTSWLAFKYLTLDDAAANREPGRDPRTHQVHSDAFPHS